MVEFAAGASDAFARIERNEPAEAFAAAGDGRAEVEAVDADTMRTGRVIARCAPRRIGGVFTSKRGKPLISLPIFKLGRGAGLSHAADTAILAVRTGQTLPICIPISASRKPSLPPREINRNGQAGSR